MSPVDMLERRRRALLVDLFITGTNAVTETGKLVNLDMIGNRVAGITFGPKHVIVIVGRNKIVPDIEDAMLRIKNFAAPANSMRLDKKTPCVKTSMCEECRSIDRICNNWTITEKSFPKGRIKVVLINEDLGL
jgi:L-lactate utilization protein LutB